MSNHVFFEAKDISHDDNWGMANIVDGGLAYCKKCRCLEGGLPTDCPETPVGYQKEQLIYEGALDYRAGEGWVEKRNPTNQTWIYGSYIRFNGDDGAFVEKEGLPMEEFVAMMKEWENRGLDLKRMKQKFAQ